LRQSKITLLYQLKLLTMMLEEIIRINNSLVLTIVTQF